MMCRPKYSFLKFAWVFHLPLSSFPIQPMCFPISPHQSSHTVSSVSRALSGVSQSLSGSVQVAFTLFDPQSFLDSFSIKVDLALVSQVAAEVTG